MFRSKRFLFLWSKPCMLCGQRSSAAWTSRQVRSTFIDFFSSQGHKFVPSSSVIPKKGEGTYFTNAGMNQFKPIFLGECRPSSQLAQLTCATNSQKCIRVGGKHNDLEDVGHDLTHHTFFEMLGNWSFGAYFKRRACTLAYDLLTNHYRIPPERLYFTYFAGDSNLGVPPDDECKDVWLSLGIPEQRVLAFGERDNFWCMGETGPCGPCSEIHFDHIGERLAPEEVNTGSPALVEIWNLVFMQYNRLEDMSLQLLPASHVDTGMGLERLTALLNGSADNYSTDLFSLLFDTISQMSKASCYQGSLGELDTSYRILADHARMITVAISDGLLPSNDNLGHKLRSLLHRCIHLSRNSFHVEPHLLLPALVNSTVTSLSCAYPELESSKSKVCDVVSSAIEYHDKQREMAVKSFNKMLARCNGNSLSGETIHSLEKGHYGNAMSLEVITELAASNGLQLNLLQYEELKSEKTASNSQPSLPRDCASPLVREMAALDVATTEDSLKYDYQPLNESLYDFRALESSESQVCGLSSDGTIVEVLRKGLQGEIILDRTCFYAEGGGQEADSGQLISESGTFIVTNTKNKDGYIVHYGHVTDGCISRGQDVKATVFTVRREGCMRNHTATHLLNTALESVVPSTQQEGSSISPYKLTFDFLALAPVKSNHIQRIEESVRNAIKLEHDVSRSVLPIEEALEIPNLKKLQNEVYPDTVAVISVGQRQSGNISAELCGGTHVANTSHLMDFCVTQLSTKSQNIKRITGVTGREALQALQCGKLLTMLSDVLQSMDLKNPCLGDTWSEVTQVASKSRAITQERKEWLWHSLQFVPECDVMQQARLEAMSVEADKSLAWVDSVMALEGQLLDSQSDDAVVTFLLSFVTTLRKGKDLELVQKSAREDAHTCLHSLEHKVTEVVNERMLKAVHKKIDDIAAQNSDEASLGIFLPKEFAPRQLVKVIRSDWAGWNHCSQLSLVHFGKKAVTLAHVRGKSSDNEESYKELMKKLQQLAPTKGKKVQVAGEEIDVFIYTMNNRTKQGSPVDESLWRHFFPSKWFNVR
ncbi:hypothetical protein RRG08_048113 [Elysia crispata]|uniref:Alanine--tRNA ligase n=1 Tax=Elysia crispata TaxID=231223 RepID=A0AAE0ZJG7_9GAST|nr:hypothetical protein RRG08_048113 [Elysia crispata]